MVGGVYREVVPDSRPVFSWAWHSTPERTSRVTVTVAKDGDGTMLTLHHEQFSTTRRDATAAVDRHSTSSSVIPRKPARREPRHKQQAPDAQRKPGRQIPRPLPLNGEDS
jgi:hypothetical protein